MMKTYRKHVLVCCTDGCCAARGGKEILRALQHELKQRKVTDVLVSPTLCSGACPKEGATVIVHPDGLWYTVTKVNEVMQIVVQHILAGQPVPRLINPAITVK